MLSLAKYRTNYCYVFSISTRLLYRLCFPDSQEHNLSLARSTDVASTDLSSTPILSLQAAKTYIDIPSIYKEHQGRLEKEVAELQELYKGELKKGNTQKEGLQKENAVDTCKHDVHQCCRALSQCQNPKHDDSISPLSGIKQQMSTAIINYHIPTPFAQVPLEWNPSYLQLPVSQTSVHVQQSRPISSTSARTSLSLLSSSVNNTSARPSTSPSTPRSIIHKPRVSIGRADSIIDSLKKRSSLESSRVFVIPRIRAITPEETINIPATRLANFQCDPGPHGDVHLTIEESHGDIQRVLKHSYKLSCAPQPGISNTDFYTHLRDRLAYWHEIDVCIIADGYSNTGKSHTLFAVEDSLLPSLATDIFLSKHDNVKVSCSAVELYLDKFWDLLNLGDTTKKYPKKYPVELELVSHRTTKFALKDVKFVEVSSPHELVKYAQMATKRRHTRETKRNSSSSRGQLVFKVRLESDDFESREITLVDLVGAERDDDLLATKDPTNLSFEEKKFNNICRGNLSTYLKLYAEYKQPGSKVENLVPNSLVSAI